jgi:thioredoxin-dependent peroxiredoxin
MYPQTVPESVFYTRIRNDALGGPNPFEWKELTSDDVFKGSRVVLFAVPGAFTPACSESHLPGYEKLHDDLIGAGADKVVCLAVNDAFVMYQWALTRQIEKVFMLPDGNGDFTRKMGMLVKRTTTGMGMRSWRYSMFVDDGRIVKLFIEDGYCDEPPGVPVQNSGAEDMLTYLRSPR